MSNILNKNSFSYQLHTQAEIFLDAVLVNLKPLNLNLDFPDHLCFRVETEEQYQEYKSKFSQLGNLLVESEVGGRDIASYKLDEPIIFNDYAIDVLELPAPKKGKYYPIGFEHVEFVVKDSFEGLIENNPNCEWDTKGTTKVHNPELRLKLAGGLSVKFHHQSLEKVIEIEKKTL